MNLPNRLTMLRILLIPVCVFLQLEEMYPWALGVFCAACVTDIRDGYLARKNNQLTVFGKFADPVADKLLVLCAMIALSAQGRLPAWCVCVVAARELAVDGLRLVAAGQNIVVAAAMAGKIKTNLQMLCVIVCMLSAFIPVSAWVITVLSALTAAATVYSGYLYFRDLKGIFTF